MEILDNKTLIVSSFTSEYFLIWPILDSESLCFGNYVGWQAYSKLFPSIVTTLIEMVEEYAIRFLGPGSNLGCVTHLFIFVLILRL